MAQKLLTLLFSKDRPLQCEFALRTLYKFCSDIEESHVIVLYKTTTEDYEESYDFLIKKYNNTRFIKETSFSGDVRKIIAGYEKVFFLVDDNVFTRKFCLSEATSSLDENRSLLGFSFRLGKNTTYCYPSDKYQFVPVEAKSYRRRDDIVTYDWTKGDGDFGYPFDLSSSMYRVADFVDVVNNINIENPNDFEWIMYMHFISVLHSGRQVKNFLAFYVLSVAFCNPINKVQTVNNNRSCEDLAYNPSNLLKLFMNGYRIDLEKFDGYASQACHEEVYFLENYERTAD